MPDQIKKKVHGKANKNVFPVYVFPDIFKDFVKALNETLKFPIDYTGTAILVAIATVTGTTVRAKVKDNWYEYGSLYASIIGNAGANKSHPIAKIFEPIRALDKQLHDEFVSKRKEYEAYIKLSPRQRASVDPVPEPILKKMVLTDFTPEVLHNILNDNLRGCAVVSDELASFFEGIISYSNRDTTSTYLSFWNNKPTTIDRVGKPIPLFILIPFLCIIGSLQPRMFSKVFKSKMMDSGLFQRFLFAFPQQIYREPINDKVMDQEILKQYSGFITDYIQNSRSNNKQTRTLTWSPEAKEYFYNWQSKNCQRVNEHADNIKGEVISKFDMHFIRLSLILQMMEDPYSTEIGIKAVKGANALCKYYMNCAFIILKKIYAPENHLNKLPQNKKQFYGALKNKFTTAEAVELGDKFNLNERRLKDFLKDKYFFMKIKHGHYEKTIKTLL